ncbi:hypothetical protein [Actinoplanes sp. NPDC051851]|uniref:hypothetical protein n=1 Tax=Actinoplanes sp. NPDC051851 TaxID=3154753 RepID=UPI003422D76F
MNAHPHSLHAATNLWSLDTALRHLADRVRSEAGARDIYGDGGTLQAWRPRPDRNPTGGHADPIGDAVLGMTYRIDTPCADRYRAATATLCWLAIHTLGDLPAENRTPIQQLLHHIDMVPPQAAAEVARWAADEDRRIRELLHLDTGQQPIPGVTCPACSRVSLATSGINATSTVVVCTNDLCTCLGDICLCGMNIHADGARHIWTAAYVSTWKVAA